MTDTSPRLRDSASKTPCPAQGPKGLQHTSAPFSNVQPEALAPLAHGTFFSLFSLFCNPAAQPGPAESTGTHAPTPAHTARASASWRPRPLRQTPTRPVPFSPHARIPFYSLKVPVHHAPSPSFPHWARADAQTQKPFSTLKHLCRTCSTPKQEIPAQEPGKLKSSELEKEKIKRPRSNEEGVRGLGKNILVHTVLALLLVNQSRTAVHASAASDPPKKKEKTDHSPLPGWPRCAKRRPSPALLPPSLRPTVQ